MNDLKTSHVSCIQRVTTTMITLAGLGLAGLAVAAPPPPPEGYRWVPDERFTDEFDGESLDKTKWHDHHPRWKGRPPAKFVPSAVSVSDGFLRLGACVLPEPDGPYTLGSGAVVSRSEEAFYGYYEARMKASGTSLSSTFWMSNRGRHANGVRVSEEIDIVEVIGAPSRYPAWNRFVHANTHISRSKNGQKKVHSSPQRAPLDPPAGEAFHTYGAWWVDANTVKIYLDGIYLFTLHPDTTVSPTPLSHPMHVNLVTETYDWEKTPSPEAVSDGSRNTTTYDWVRAFTLEKLPDLPPSGTP